MDINVFVRGGNNGNYEGMTKEEILAAIAQAIQQGTVGDIDTGFVTTIKEQNKGQGLMFWVGTTAEYEALTEKPNNVLYIRTDDTSATDINSRFTTLTEAVNTLQESLSGYAPKQHASTLAEEYGRALTTQYGHVMLSNEYRKSANARWTVDPATAIEYSGTAVTYADATTLVLPVGAVIILTESSPNMPYGSWSQIKTEVLDGQTTLYYYKRTN